MLRLRRREAHERGAAAVEFALVSLVAIPMVLGILQFGLYFNDGLQLRQGIRQTARTGVVQGSTGCSGTYAAQLLCYARKQVSPVTGDVAVMVSIPDVAGWKKGNRLVVCAMVASSAKNVGLVPVPNDSVIRSKTMMSIEQDKTIPAGFPLSDSLSDPAWAGQDWSWCK